MAVCVGRPPLPPGEVSVVVIGNLRLRKSSDADLVRWFDAIPPGKLQAALKAALRSGGMMVSSSQIDEQAELDEAISDLSF